MYFSNTHGLIESVVDDDGLEAQEALELSEEFLGLMGDGDADEDEDTLI